MTHVTGSNLEALDRFVEAQAPAWESVVAELQNGHKETHWMWFVFPQLSGLGHSRMSQRFAIADLKEASDYAKHAILGPRLHHCFNLLVAHRNKTVEDIFGTVDARKLQSCATLFRACGFHADLLDEVLAIFYRGEPDPNTLALLRR